MRALEAVDVAFGSDEREAVKNVLDPWQSEQFAEEWIAECESGKGRLRDHRGTTGAHPLEQIGLKLRDMMPWLQANGKGAEAKPKYQARQ